MKAFQHIDDLPKHNILTNLVFCIGLVQKRITKNGIVENMQTHLFTFSKYLSKDFKTLLCEVIIRPNNYLRLVQ